MRQLNLDDPIILTRDPVTVTAREEQLLSIPVPDFRIALETIPSWNNFLAISRYNAASSMIEKWRKIGYDKAIFFARRDERYTVTSITTYEATKRGAVKEVTTEKISQTILGKGTKLILRYWRPAWTVYDVFNPFAKPIVDGFIDAGLLAKDNQEYINEFTVKFMGIDSKLVLSAEGKETRKIAKIGKKGGSKPVPARYWFDFYKPTSNLRD